MALFEPLYKKVMSWAKHPLADRYLIGLSFAESSFFPIPPDVMLAPMVLVKPERAWYLAFVTTLASVLGGVLGYCIGYFAIEALMPWLETSHYYEPFQVAQTWFKNWGFWAIFIAGFSPIPYKVFTIAAGTMSMVILPFILASFVGRGLRFFMVAGLMAWGGATMEQKLGLYIERIGWTVVLLVVIGVLLFKVLA